MPRRRTILEWDTTPPLHVLLASNGSKDVAKAESICVRLSRDDGFHFRTLTDQVTPRLRQMVAATENEFGPLHEGRRCTLERRGRRLIVESLMAHTEILVLAPMYMDHLKTVVEPGADKNSWTMMQNVLSKYIANPQQLRRLILVPCCDEDEWNREAEHAAMVGFLAKLRSSYPSVCILSPILWRMDAETEQKTALPWDGFPEIIWTLQNEKRFRDFLIPDPDDPISAPAESAHPAELSRASVKLPPEVWLIVFKYVNDWELCQTMGFGAAKLRTPDIWRLTTIEQHSRCEISSWMSKLERLLLYYPQGGNRQAMRIHIQQAPGSLVELSALSVRLIFRYALIDALESLDQALPHVFQATFTERRCFLGNSLLVDRTEILDWAESRWKSDFVEAHCLGEAGEDYSRLNPTIFWSIKLDKAVESWAYKCVRDWWRQRSPWLGDMESHHHHISEDERRVDGRRPRA